MSTEVVVVNWNNRQETLACLDAVVAQLGEVEAATVTVVDNGSDDGSPTAIAARHPNAKLFALRENRGFTGGLAAALAGSTARNVVFLNNDAVPEPGWLAALVRAIDEAPEDVVSVGGKIVDPTGNLIDFIGGLMTFDGHAFQNGFRYPVGAREEPQAGDELLFAYLHRLHHYATTRNPAAKELRRPFGVAAESRAKRLLRRESLAPIDDPLTAMQFRAFDWIIQHEAHIARKRHDVQSRRKRPDREIFERFPLHFVPTYPGDESLMQSALFRLLRPALPAVDRKLSDIIRS